MVIKVGERSCSSDSKRRALAEGKSVRISYLLFHHFAFLNLLDFSHCIFEFSKHPCMLETFLALFCFSQKSKIISEHENSLKNNFEHLSKQSLAGHPKFQNLLPFGSPWALAVSQWAHRGPGRTLGSADPTRQRLPATFFQRLVIIVLSS